MRLFAVAVPLTVLLFGCARAPETPLEPLPTGAPPTTAQKQVAKSAGKSTDDLSGAEILTAADKALRQAGSVHVVGYVAGPGGAVVAIDMRYRGQQQATGFVKVNGHRVDLIRLGATAYARADAAILESLGEPVATAEQRAGRYLRFPAEADTTKGLTAFVEVSTMLGPMFQTKDLVIKGAHKVVRGVRTVGVTSPHSSAQTAYVAVTGKPYLMLIVPRIKGVDYSLNFSDYGKPVAVAAPPGAQVVSVPSDPAG
jgi:hypothetical protein